MHVMHFLKIHQYHVPCDTVRCHSIHASQGSGSDVDVMLVLMYLRVKGRAFQAAKESEEPPKVARDGKSIRSAARLSEP